SLGWTIRQSKVEVGHMKERIKRTNVVICVVSALLIICALDAGAFGQTQPNAFKESKEQKIQNVNSVNMAIEAGEIDPYFRQIYRNFFETYRLGPADEIAIRVVGQPDYTIEKAQVSPVGRVYHPLVGDVDVAGMTITQVTDKLRLLLSELIVDPRLSVSLLSA